MPAGRRSTPQVLRSTHGTVLSRQPDASILASGPAPATESYRVRGHHRAVAHHRHPPGGAAGPDAAQGRPGARLLRQLRADRPHASTAAPAGGGRARLLSPSQQGRADDSFGSSDLRDLLMKPAEEKGDLPSGWAVDATRDETRLRRQAVFKPALPLAYAGRRHRDRDALVPWHRGEPGARALSSVRHRRRGPDAGREHPREDARRARAGGVRSHRRSDEGTRRRRIRTQAPALAPPRERSETLKDAIKALDIVSALVLQERAVTRAAVHASSRARQLPVQGREALCGHAARAATDAATTRCRTASGSRAGS